MAVKYGFNVKKDWIVEEGAARRMKFGNKRFTNDVHSHLENIDNEEDALKYKTYTK